MYVARMRKGSFLWFGLLQSARTDEFGVYKQIYDEDGWCSQ